MSALPAYKLESAEVPPPAPASGPIDHVEILPLDAEEVRNAAQTSGPLFASWLEYWHSLDTSERDPLSHPRWVAGHLEGQLRTNTHAATGVLVASAGGRPRSVLPVRVPRPGALEHAKGFIGKSWALARADHAGTLERVFRIVADGQRVRSLYIPSVETPNALLEFNGPTVVSPVSFRSRIELEGGFEGAMTRLNSKTRNGVRRLFKKIARDHTTELETVTEISELDDAFARFLEVDDRSWKNTSQRGKTLRDDAKQRESLRAALDHMARADRTVVQLLRADGADIAAQLCVIIDRQLVVVKTSYDAEWSRYGAGKLLLAESMRSWCDGRDIDAVNMITGLDWHLQWAPTRIGTNAVWFFPGGLRGALGRLRDVPARENAKALVRQLGLEESARRLMQRGKK